MSQEGLVGHESFNTYRRNLPQVDVHDIGFLTSTSAVISDMSAIVMIVDAAEF